MKRMVLAVTGTRADYGLMRPVFREIAGSPGLELELIVTAMHLAPQFREALGEVETDRFGKLHRVDAGDGSESGAAMARALGRMIAGMTEVIVQSRPDIVLLQGDRGEMLAGAIAAAHQNVAIAHMSGGDVSGSIDDSLRNAISSFAHVHLTTCAPSTARLVARGEAPERVFQVGEPALDAIKHLDAVAPENLASELQLDLSRPVALATQHPVSTEAMDAGRQIVETLEAIRALNLQTVITYPNTDAGSAESLRVLNAYADCPLLRIVPHLGSRKYLSLMKIAAVMIGNSSSGLIEAPSFRLAAVNIGTRQHGRTRSSNVIDVGYDRVAIRDAISFALTNADFRRKLQQCINPYGEGDTAQKTVNLLERLRLSEALLVKWIAAGEPLLDQ